jgi:outer membrane scaffolding protein for murein synthesis (MipA/OmpV family)
VRHGIRSYGGVVADLSADAFMDVTPTIRVSAGPRLSFASNDYVDAYYKVDTHHSLKSGLKKYDPDGGLTSAGLGGAINWKATEKIEAGAFADYKRLVGDVADSSLVKQRGSADQFTIGIYSTYRFGFTLP